MSWVYKWITVFGVFTICWLWISGPISLQLQTNSFTNCFKCCLFSFGETIIFDRIGSLFLYRVSIWFILFFFLIFSLKKILYLKLFKISYRFCYFNLKNEQNDIMFQAYLKSKRLKNSNMTFFKVIYFFEFNFSDGPIV